MVYLFIAAAYTIFLMLLRGWFLRRRTKKLENQLHAMEAAVWFARSRDELFLAAMRGETDPRSAPFRALYRLNTYVMRRPSKHDSIARVLLQAIAAMDPDKDGEIEEADDAILEAGKLASKGINQLIMNHSRLVRWLTGITPAVIGVIRFLRWSSTMLKTGQRVKVRLLEQAVARDDDLRVFYSSRDTLANLAPA